MIVHFNSQLITRGFILYFDNNIYTLNEHNLYYQVIRSLPPRSFFLGHRYLESLLSTEFFHFTCVVENRM